MFFLVQNLLPEVDNFMNYKNLVFTGLIGLSLMSHGSGTSKPQRSSDSFFWTPLALVGITGFLGLNGIYHHVKTIKHRREFDRNADTLGNLTRGANDTLNFRALNQLAKKMEADITESNYHKKQRGKMIELTSFYGGLLGLSLALKYLDNQ